MAWRGECGEFVRSALAGIRHGGRGEADVKGGVAFVGAPSKCIRRILMLAASDEDAADDADDELSPTQVACQNSAAARARVVMG